MFFKVSDKKSRALIEVDVTWHPGAIRDMLTAQDGFVRSGARLICFLVLMYLSVGYEITSGKYFPELGFHPAVLLLAHLAMTTSVGWTMAAAFVCGMLLSAGFAAPLWSYALLLTIVCGCVSSLSGKAEAAEKENTWGRCALCGACANGIFTVVNTLIAGNLRDFPEQVLLSTALAAVSYMPAISFLLNIASRRDKTEKLQQDGISAALNNQN